MPALTPLEVEALRLSLRVGLVSVAASLPFGIAVAWLLARRQFPGKILVDGLVHLPLVLPPVVVGYGLLVLFGRNGPIGGWLYDVFGVTVAFNWKGAALASAAMAFPLMVRAMRLSLELVDRRLEAAARTLGAGRARVFLTITVPLMAPGILTGAILGFARSISEFGATITFVSNIPGETRTLPLALYALTQVPGGDAAAWRLAVLSVLLAMAALVASELLARRLDRRIRGVA
ncbi:MAG TPA: molybdate ABC transporter permease subunit [Stellaceae bacterium]|nr:molybdate ABC transporter permease subunit [Stellaceae bacterium]